MERGDRRRAILRLLLEAGILMAAYMAYEAVRRLVAPSSHEAIGLVMFATLPVAPPRMFPEFGFIDTVHVHSGLYRSIQQSDFVNEFAAVPSFHFGWILLVGMAVFQTT